MCRLQVAVTGCVPVGAVDLYPVAQVAVSVPPTIVEPVVVANPLAPVWVASAEFWHGIGAHDPSYDHVPLAVHEAVTPP